MKLEELANFIALSPEKDKLEKISLTLKLYNGEKTIEGLYNIYERILKENIFWEDKDNLPYKLKQSKKFFSSALSYLTDNLEYNQINSFQNWYNNFTYHLENNINVDNSDLFLSTDPVIDIIIEIYKEYPDDNSVLNGFIEMITAKSKKEKGQIMAYEFLTKDSIITERKESERKSLNNIRKEYEELLSNSNTFLSNHIKSSQEKVDEFEDSINTLKAQINGNMNQKSNEVATWSSNIKEEIGALKNLYIEKLRLEAPATYWDMRAAILNTKGDNARNILIGLIILTAIILIFWFFFSPTGILSKVISGNAIAIKWLFASITIVSFLAYGIRAMNKVMFSNYHLARDAEERELLTYLYLALMKDNKVEKEDRNIILQSLFSRADTGLLKEESSPSMPSAIIEKLTTK